MSRNQPTVEPPTEETSEQWKEAVALTYPGTRLSPERKCLKLFVDGWLKQGKSDAGIWDALTAELRRQRNPNDSREEYGEDA